MDTTDDLCLPDEGASVWSPTRGIAAVVQRICDDGYWVTMTGLPSHQPDWWVPGDDIQHWWTLQPDEWMLEEVNPELRHPCEEPR